MYGRDADAREQWTRRVSGSTCSGQFRSVHFSWCAVNKPLDEFERGMSDAWNNKKLSYRRGTARCVVSVEILPIATQQCINYLYDKSWTKYQLSPIVPRNKIMLWTALDDLCDKQ